MKKSLIALALVGAFAAPTLPKKPPCSGAPTGNIWSRSAITFSVVSARPLNQAGAGVALITTTRAASTSEPGLPTLAG